MPIRPESDGKVWISGKELDAYLNRMRVFREKQRREKLAQEAVVWEERMQPDKAPDHEERVAYFSVGAVHPDRGFRPGRRKNPNRSSSRKRKSA